MQEPMIGILLDSLIWRIVPATNANNLNKVKYIMLKHSVKIKVAKYVFKDKLNRDILRCKLSQYC